MHAVSQEESPEHAVFKVDNVEQMAVFELEIILVLEPLVLAADLVNPSAIFVT